MSKRLLPLALLLLVLPLSCTIHQKGTVSAVSAGSAGGQTWTTETLSNGLTVIYAPMPSSPTTHVRVIYHVGSRDERPDRQGFAHMFEHMMFRGSAHVAPQEHMKLIGQVGGYSNASTSFDETVYVNTLPASYTEMALWLEADRMSSFKVSPQIYVTERQVVGQEFSRRLNQPYGGMYDQLQAVEFKVHPYHWTPIGNMDHLQAAQPAELQEFFNKYYVPNNAILVIAGNIEVEKTRAEVKRYFGWIPGRGLQVGNGGNTSWLALQRNIPQEPPQTEPRRLDIKMPVPMARMVLAYHLPPAKSENMDPIGLLLTILGDGESSRINKALVTSDNPLCVSAGALAESLEDGGFMGVDATILEGKDPAAVGKVIREQIAAIRDRGVTPEELEKAKQLERVNLAQRFETAEKVASDLGSDMFTYGNLNRVPTARARLEAITAADVQRVAQQYLQDNGCTTMVVSPGQVESTPKPAVAATATSTQPVAAPAVNFPADYPTKPPMSGKLPEAVFEKGVENTIAPANGAASTRVIVMEDHRMPMINWTLALRAGSDATEHGKEGVASLTAAMIRRGPRGKTYNQFNDELESRGISLGVSDGRDVTTISGSCLKEQFAFALAATRDMLLTPAFDTGEFQRLHEQSLASLQLSLNNPAVLAARRISKDLYGDSPLGRLTTLDTMKTLTLDDVKQFYTALYRLDRAIVMISGDISVADGQKAAAELLRGFSTGALPKVEYTLPAAPTALKLVLIDKPDARQAAIRFAAPAYSIASDEKFAGSLASQILSADLDARLPHYVRAEKGLVYNVQGVFSPGRQAGAFQGVAECAIDKAGDTVTAIFKVLDDMRSANVTDTELANAKFRVAGGLLMTMETISDQASRRLDGILNGYPIDYYDKYAQRISQVTADQVRADMTKYVQENRSIVVVVGPAESVRPQLEKLGKVEVVAADAK
jgi:zinc protease